MATPTPPTKKTAKKAAAKPKSDKPRAPRKDYGFAKDAKIVLTDGEKSYRGKRLEMYEALKKSNGKTVQHFLDNNKNEKDPPRGWLRFFVTNEACKLEGGTKVEPKPKKESKAA